MRLITIVIFALDQTEISTSKSDHSDIGRSKHVGFELVREMYPYPPQRSN